jgi:hypothetical protein
MGRIVIVPDSLDKKIHELIDKIIPEDGEDSREHFRSILLGYFDEHGRLPDVSQIEVKRND